MPLATHHYAARDNGIGIGQLLDTEPTKTLMSAAAAYRFRVSKIIYYELTFLPRRE